MLQIIGLVLICLAMVMSLGLIIFGLPGTWIILLLAVAAGAIEGFQKINLTIILILLGIAILGEILEFLIGYLGARVKGASRMASLAAIVFGIAGAVLLSGTIPIVGALIGAFAGSFFGAFLVEYIRNQKLQDAYKSGMAAMFGRMGSILSKIAVGVAMIVIVIYRLV